MPKNVRGVFLNYIDLPPKKKKKKRKKKKVNVILPVRNLFC